MQHFLALWLFCLRSFFGSKAFLALWLFWLRGFFDFVAFLTLILTGSYTKPKKPVGFDVIFLHKAKKASRFLIYFLWEEL